MNFTSQLGTPGSQLGLIQLGYAGAFVPGGGAIVLSVGDSPATVPAELDSPSLLLTLKDSP